MPEQIDETIKPKIYNDPISVAKRAKQKVYFAAQVDKSAMLEKIIRGMDKAQALVLIKTKRAADNLSQYLKTRDINALAIHSNKGKQACEIGARAFEEGEIDILITTDMILQSLELKDVEYVLGYDLPIEPEHYLDRIGCMSETGEAISLVSEEEETFLFLIERMLRQEIPQEELEGFDATPKNDAEVKPVKTQKKKPRHRKQKSKKKGVEVKEEKHDDKA